MSNIEAGHGKLSHCKIGHGKLSHCKVGHGKLSHCKVGHGKLRHMVKWVIKKRLINGPHSLVCVLKLPSGAVAEREREM